MRRWDKWRKHRRNHAKIRAEERYGIKLGNQDLLNIVGMIKKNNARTVVRLSTSKSIKVVNYMGHDFIVVYSCKHHEIITFLPRASRWGSGVGIVLSEEICA
jgi:hypothetical protein